MAMRDICTFGNPALRTPCEPTVDRNEGVRSLVDDLLETVDGSGRASRSGWSGMVMFSRWDQSIRGGKPSAENS